MVALSLSRELLEEVDQSTPLHEEVGSIDHVINQRSSYAAHKGTCGHRYT